MSNRLLYPRTVFVAIAGLFAASLVGLNAQQSAEAVRVGKDAIGGVVTSAKGPEAGVWVIAETKDLPAKFVKIVVTDDRGRYVTAAASEGELQSMGTRVWACGFPTRAGQARQDPKPEGRRGAKSACRSGILPSHLLVFPASGAGEKRVPWNRAQGQRHSGEHEKPGPMAAPGKDG
jgi:hypothetical protein